MPNKYTRYELLRILEQRDIRGGTDRGWSIQLNIRKSRMITTSSKGKVRRGVRDIVYLYTE